MTRSIFDPTGPDTERSGSRNLGPDAQNISHMPPDAMDGVVERDSQELDTSPDLEALATASQEEAARASDREQNLQPGQETVE